ncbi:PREDICTED: DC-STAMP domain-containing protein 1-like [Bactrocera latifrons]|uniref:DC-STAMP domain-containing protein 1-like n=1 Tax=Bactrocera latifrons TaxID=174628 RepID=UPI0008DE7117|nr:PREDICTED: DC-STAMP domain-containing protein 1-like [Bactrocera latifrons]
MITPQSSPLPYESPLRRWRTSGTDWNQYGLSVRDAVLGIPLREFEELGVDEQIARLYEVKGSGLMARLLQRTLKNFNIHEQISTFLTNEYCLPNAHILPKRFYLKLAATNVIIIVLIYKCYYFMRMRRIICSYFYHKREKQRILYLYNSLLRKRKTVREVMRMTAESNVHKRRIRRRINLLLFLRLKWPNYCSWYKFCAATRLKCLICDGLEDLHYFFPRICPNNITELAREWRC